MLTGCRMSLWFLICLTKSKKLWILSFEDSEISSDLAIESYFFVSLNSVVWKFSPCRLRSHFLLNFSIWIQQWNFFPWGKEGKHVRIWIPERCGGTYATCSIKLTCLISLPQVDIKPSRKQIEPRMLKKQSPFHQEAQSLWLPSWAINQTSCSA